DYNDYDNTEAGVIIYYDNIALCVELSRGKDLWRHEIKYDGNRSEKSLPVLWWTTSEESGKRFLFATNDGVLLLDANTGKELWSTEMQFTDIEEVEAVTFYGNKALLMYDDDQIGFLDMKSGKQLWTRKQDIGDIEGYSALENLGGTNYLLLSADDTQIMINLTDGSVQWEKKEEELEGILTKYRVAENGKNVLCYFKRKAVMGSNSGTHLDLCMIETKTGKIIYKQEIAMTTYAPIEGIANFLSKALLGQKIISAHDYFFVFDEYDVEGDVVFLIRGTAGASGMCNPETRDDDGEGLVRINLATGEIKYRSYFPLNSVGFRWSAVNFDIKDAPQPIVNDGKVYVVGAERVVCADMKTGKVNWKIDDDLGFPTNWKFHDNTIFLKVGKQAFNAAVEAKSGDMNVSKAWNKDPYRIYAIDPADGKIIWNIEFENDPGLSMDVVFDEKSKTIYGADEEEVFAVKLTRDSGGKKLWSFNFDKDGKVGELEHEECYAVTQSSSSSSSLSFTGSGLSTTTTTHYEASAELVLQPHFRGDHFIIFGPDGVCSVGLDGKLQWTTEWNWAGKKVTLQPHFLSSGYITFMVKEDIQLLDEKTGKLFWKEEDDYDAKPLLSPNHKYLYMLEDDEVRVFKMTP
ncbi:MAG: PQQ-binding-like beta-propeller repeat protein, partial [Ignavibacteriae bacterium]|nr:PQQ-binding-like beta-propeller repeat protein [Ignavibacteriota bacterium]